MIDNNLKDCREDLDMTQTELGEILGVKKATISNWENGYDIIPFSKLIKFCDLYDYSIDYVVGLTRRNKKYNKIGNIDKKEVGKKLKNLRKKLGFTQQKMADECAISREAYSHYEIGMNLVSTITIYTILKKHNISIDSFLRNSEIDIKNK